ncbi:MAG: right-handed parallel beta-helix repeat-containing protein [Candidatus Thorarchaeota archaeon]
MFCILEVGGFVLGVGRKRKRLLLALALLLLTPYLATAGHSRLNERKMESITPIDDYTSAQRGEPEPIFVDSPEDFESYGFPGDGSASNPYTIQDLNISYSRSACISILNVNVCFVISNCILEGNSSLYPIIWLRNVQNSTIEENIVIGGREGIIGSQTRNLRILGNTICDGNGGLKLIGSLNITVVDNSIYRNSFGIELDSTTNCSFSTNRIYGNREWAGFLVGETSRFNAFNSNLVGWNVWGTSWSFNALDYGGNNTWFSNSWSDYTPPGPYNISGDAYSQDVQPTLLVDVEAPQINSPVDVVMGEGSQVIVSWYPRDAFPFEYTLLLDAEITSTRLWIDDEISFNLQYLDPGDYNLIISVTDGSGNTTTDMVFVSILYVFLRDIGTELVAYASILSVLLFIVVLWLIKRRPLTR